MKTIIITLTLIFSLIQVWADDLTKKDFKPYNSYSIDDYAGLGEDRDVEQIWFSKRLIEQAKKEKGIVKISTWTWRGKLQYYAQRLVEQIDGVKVWRGPNPPMGYHTCQRTYQVIDYSKSNPLP